jgi:hypothetical protein
MNDVSQPPAQPKPKLVDRVRHATRTRHYSRRTDSPYVHWIKRFIFFHGKRHPAEMGQAEVTEFLSALAVQKLLGHTDVSTTMIYAHVLNRGWGGVLSPADSLAAAPVQSAPGLPAAARPLMLPAGFDNMAARAAALLPQPPQQPGDRQLGAIGPRPD